MVDKWQLNRNWAFLKRHRNSHRKQRIDWILIKRVKTVRKCSRAVASPVIFSRNSFAGSIREAEIIRIHIATRQWAGQATVGFWLPLMLWLQSGYEANLTSHSNTCSQFPWAAVPSLHLFRAQEGLEEKLRQIPRTSVLSTPLRRHTLPPSPSLSGPSHGHT